jgi:hypothetical protein
LTLPNPFKRDRSLHRLIYLSTVANRSAADIPSMVQAILEQSAPRNAAVGVTGALLACNGWFLQALEGDRVAVGDTYDHILADPRHKALTLIAAGPIAARTFAPWSLCGQALTAADDTVLRALGGGDEAAGGPLSASTALRLLTLVGSLQPQPAIRPAGGRMARAG